MKIGKHTVYWIGVITLLTLFFGQESRDFQQAFYFATLLMPVAMGTTYVFIYYLIPHYLLKKKFFQFGLYLLYALIISLYLEMMSAVGAFIIIANYQYENMNPLSVDIVTMGITIFFIVFVTAFGQLLGKYFSTEEELTQLNTEKEKEKTESIQVRSDRKLVPIKLEDLCFIESLGDYVKIHTSSDQIITKEKISKLESELPSYFIRVHRSFLVNGRLIESFTKEHVNTCNQQIPISRTYKKQVMQLLMKD